MRLSSLRLGGSMVLCDGYRWKNFRGPAEHRQPYAGVWYRYDSGGWKVFEFLELCEAAGIDTCVVTLPVTETVADLEDLAEYAFGPASSTWGALRVKDGRAKPYRPFIIEIGNENTLNYTQPEANPCRDGCQNFTKRWLERALAMDGKAQALGLNLTFVVGFDAGIGGGQSCSQETVRQSKASIVELAGWAAQLGERAVWDCHTGGDSPADGAVTAGALIELRQILRDAGSDMRAAVLEENGGTHNMLRMLGHVTQNHALSRLGEFIVVNTVATGLQPLGRNSNGWDQGNIYFTPNASDPRKVSGLQDIGHKVAGDDSEFIVDTFEQFLNRQMAIGRSAPFYAHLCFHSIHEPHPDQAPLALGALAHEHGVRVLGPLAPAATVVSVGATHMVRRLSAMHARFHWYRWFGR